MEHIILRINHTPTDKRLKPSVKFLSEKGLVLNPQDAKLYAMDNRSAAVKDAVRSKFPAKIGDLFTVDTVEFSMTKGLLASQPRLCWESEQEIKAFEYVSLAA